MAGGGCTAASLAFPHGSPAPPPAAILIILQHGVDVGCPDSKLRRGGFDLPRVLGVGEACGLACCALEPAAGGVPAEHLGGRVENCLVLPPKVPGGTLHIESPREH